MFCPNCGKGDQKENSFCRKCGEFLPDLNRNASVAFGGLSPQQNAKSISFVSLFASVFSLLVGLWLYATNFSVPFVIYLAAAVLICNAFWHASNFYVVRKLANRLNRKKPENLPNSLTEAKVSAQNFLPEADAKDFIAPPTSIIENTTKHLSEKITRKSS